VVEQTEHSKPVRLAAAAFQAGLAGKWRAAERAVQRIGDECGEEGVNTAMLAWCDTLIAHASGEAGMAPRRIGIQFWHGETGELDAPGSQRVPAETQWAARLLQARAAMDQGAWIAACEDLPEDRLAIGQHVWAVLQLTVWQVNGLPSGYTRMGVGRG